MVYSRGIKVSVIEVDSLVHSSDFPRQAFGAIGFCLSGLATSWETTACRSMVV